MHVTKEYYSFLQIDKKKENIDCMGTIKYYRNGGLESQNIYIYNDINNNL